MKVRLLETDSSYGKWEGGAFHKHHVFTGWAVITEATTGRESQVQQSL